MKNYFKISLLFFITLFGVSLGVNKSQATIVDADVMFYYTLDSNEGHYHDYIVTDDSRVLTAPGDVWASTTGQFGLAWYDSNNTGSGSGENCMRDTTGSWAEKSSGSWSLSFWAKNGSDSGNFDIISIDGNNNLRIDRRSTDYLNIAYYASGNWREANWDNVFSTDNAWHNYVLTGTWGSMSTTFKIYRDGTDLNVSASSLDNGTPSTSGSDVLAIGGESSSCNYAWKGAIDDLAMFSKALSQTEITELQSSSLADILDPPYYCGDNTCNGTETTATCFADCADPTIVILSSANQLTGSMGGNWTIPFYYNFCNDYSYLTTSLYATIEINGDYYDTQIYDPDNLPQQCSGIKNFVGAITATTTDSGTTYATIVDDPVSNEIYGTSQTINYVINNGLSSNDYLDSMVLSPLTIQVGTATTTDISFAYSVDGLNYASSSVCLYNEDSQTTTSFCSNLSATAGVGSITITNPSVADSLNAKFVLLLNNTIILQSKSFIINWFGYSNRSLQNYLGTTTAAIACSAEEWATPDPVWGIDWLNATTSVPALNFTKLKCNILTGLLNVAEGIANAPGKAYESSKEALLMLFPINIPTQIKRSWDESATTTLPVELAFLDIADANGNISIDLPSSLFEATTTIPIWGPQIYEANDNVEDAMNNIKVLSKYLLWILFIVEIFGLGWKVWQDIDGTTTKFDLEDININPAGGVSTHYRRE